MLITSLGPEHPPVRDAASSSVPGPRARSRPHAGLKPQLHESVPSTQGTYLTRGALASLARYPSELTEELDAVPSFTGLSRRIS